MAIVRGAWTELLKGNFEKDFEAAMSQKPTSRPIWYLAHPVRSDDKFTVVDNMDHAIKLQNILLEQGILTIAPWYSWTDLYRDTKNDDQDVMDQMFKIDLECIRLTGHLILTGHRLSFGMEIELRTALAQGCTVLNLIGVPDDSIPTFLELRR